jgi:hypothetical protein
LLILAVFRLGQSSRAPDGAAGPEVVPAAAYMPEPANAGEIEVSREPVEPVKAVGPGGGNRIVIQAYKLSEHLEPVRRYFARAGVGTEIREVDGWYYLVTTEKYDSVDKPGSDGYRAKQRIIELGAQYRAPPGYETFGRRPFHDCYGKKFND